MDFIFIRSANTVITREEAQAYERVYLEDLTLVSREAKVLEFLSPNWFWLDRVKLKGTAYRRVVEWVKRQTTLSFICLQTVVSDKGSFLESLCYSCLKSPVSGCLKRLRLDDMEWSRREVLALGKCIEFNSVLESLYMSRFRPTPGAEPFLAAVWLKISKIEKWTIFRRVISPKECTAMALSFSVPTSMSKTNGFTICISNAPGSHSSLLKLLEAVQKQPHTISFNVTVPNVTEEQRGFFKKCLGATANIHR